MVLFVIGCKPPETTTPGESRPPQAVQQERREASATEGQDAAWHSKLGKTVTLTGKAINHKIKATGVR